MVKLEEGNEICGAGGAARHRGRIPPAPGRRPRPVRGSQRLLRRRPARGAALRRPSGSAVVGGGNSAGQAAVWLARGGALVTLLHRRADLRETMSSYLIDELERYGVAVRDRSEVSALHGDDGQLEAVTLSDGDAAAVLLPVPVPRRLALHRAGSATRSPATTTASSSPAPRPAPTACSRPASPASTRPATCAPARSSAARPRSARAPAWSSSSTRTSRRIGFLPGMKVESWSLPWPRFATPDSPTSREARPPSLWR